MIARSKCIREIFVVHNRSDLPYKRKVIHLEEDTWNFSCSGYSFKGRSKSNTAMSFAV
jgi:hypothetical protein